MRFVTLILGLTLGACASAATEPADELPLALAEWSALELRDYRFDFQRVCFCVPSVTEPVTITVRDGLVADVRSRQTGEPRLLAAQVPWPTFADVLHEAAQARREGQRVIIEYGAQGLPVRIEIGEIARDAGVLYVLGKVVPL